MQALYILRTAHLNAMPLSNWRLGASAVAGPAVGTGNMVGMPSWGSGVRSGVRSGVISCIRIVLEPMGSELSTLIPHKSIHSIIQSCIY